jgi:hypothetical protein
MALESSLRAAVPPPKMGKIENLLAYWSHPAAARQSAVFQRYRTVSCVVERKILVGVSLAEQEDGVALARLYRSVTGSRKRQV